MKRGLGVLVALAALAIVPAGCAAPVSGNVEISGTLRIKGNEPFTVAVLEQDGARTWQIDGVRAAELHGYAGRRVSVRGRIVREMQEGMLPPTIVIDSPEAVRPR